MRAAVMRDSAIVVDTVPDPEPRTGEVLVRTLACGICGSDLHALGHMDEMMEMVPPGVTSSLDATKDIVMGHEFCAEVLDHGPDTPATIKTGSRVVSMPVLFRGTHMHGVGYSSEVPGGYGELMVLNASLLLEVPNGLATEHAALTEPMAVGVHAVEKAAIQPGEAAVVYGCGPVGLAVIAALGLRQVEPIVAADFSPLRRALATTMGAHGVVDPAERPAIDLHRELAGGRSTVLFECIGVPGVLDEIMRDAPRGGRIVVVGVCMEPDRIRPMAGIAKELSLHFVMAYQPHEFADALAVLADGRIDVAPLVTGQVGVDGVARAFEDLGRPDRHAKILVEPWRR